MKDNVLLALNLSRKASFNDKNVVQKITVKNIWIYNCQIKFEKITVKNIWKNNGQTQYSVHHLIKIYFKYSQYEPYQTSELASVSLYSQ